MNFDGHKPVPHRLPSPTYAPALMAVGILGLLWGAVTAWEVSAAGFVVAAIAAVRWIRDAREDARSGQSARARGAL
jgi:hypothetical protein